jgi:hypothetical protein
MTRQDHIAQLLARHTRITIRGRHIGCLCGHPTARLGHYKHLAQLIDELITNERTDSEREADENAQWERDCGVPDTR